MPPPTHPATAVPAPDEPDLLEALIRDCVSWRPLNNLWDLQGVPVHVIARRTWNSIVDNNLFGGAAELGYWFLFALFPTLVSASSLVGIAARHAAANYDQLLHYMAIVIPPSAYGIVLETFNQITAASNGRKFSFGLAIAIWAASSGFSAIQDSMNDIYKIKETRPYWKVRGGAVLISTLISFLITGILAELLLADYFAHQVHRHIASHFFADPISTLFIVLGRIVSVGLIALLFAVIYYWGPDVQTRQWRWLTPGGAIGILGCALASASFRIYLHFFNSYTAAYGSLGAVIILLTWLYLNGLMLLIGAAVNSEIEAAATEHRLSTQTEHGP